MTNLRIFLLLSAAILSLSPAFAENRAEHRPHVRIYGATGDASALPDFRSSTTGTGESFVIREGGARKREWRLFEPSYLNESHVKFASLSPNSGGMPGYPKYALLLSLTPEGQHLLRDASIKLLGKPMAITINGRLASVATVRSELNSHALEVSTDAFTDRELEELVRSF